MMVLKIVRNAEKMREFFGLVTEVLRKAHETLEKCVNVLDKCVKLRKSV